MRKEKGRTALKTTKKDEAPRVDRPYKESHYLLFGDPAGAAYRDNLDCAGASAYLKSRGIDGGALTHARHLRHKAEEYAGFRLQAERVCDFCGRELVGTEYERLKDGRDRCSECSDSVVKGQEAFEALFSQVRDGLCAKFGIDLPRNLEVKVVSQARLSRMIGKKFVPTRHFATRPVGFAVNRRKSYGLVFENGTPRLSLVATTAHELTHLWQYANWDKGTMDRRYGGASLAVYEGMAKWVEIQYLYLLNERAYAERALEREVQREDIYGYGLKLFLNEYPLSEGIALSGPTPFQNPSSPLP